MQFSTLALAALASLASAQTVHVVKVGVNNSLTYEPSDLTAAVGDMVQFQFFSGNHTATQSTFDKPCSPISQNSNITGFHSGFIPAAASEAMGMRAVYSIMINNTQPLWIYCAKGNHCESGMAMVINKPAANPNRTLAAYKELAKGATTELPTGGATGGTPGQTDATNGTSDGGAADTGAQGAGAGMLVAPSTVLLAAAGFAALLL
ncbi:hypothetical protein QBC37DRAFT_285569 [Rhypophila decipiens]|uniref:Extracellular serine-rich protein n=1 Tax=Rhypophila decipiens TaxID=261697 RepID=A0AAN6Y6L3_9PEZI|nr:hypothetical protein QBC37DRAFT_285569 [Rhypophila decipiens]